MIIEMFDLINTALQVFMYIFIPNLCVSEENKASRKVFIVEFGVLFLQTKLIDKIISYSPASSIAMFLFTILVIGIVYRKSIKDALLAFTIINLIIMIISMISVGIYLTIMNTNKVKAYDPKIAIFVGYLPQIILLSVIIYFKEVTYKVFSFFSSKKDFLVPLIFINGAVVLVGVFYTEVFCEMRILLKIIMLVIFLLFFITSSVYFITVKNNASKIVELNTELEDLNEKLNSRVNELRKIKHDYGSELSMLYGLFQLKDYTRLNEMFRDTIERNHDISNNEVKCYIDEPIIQASLKPAIDAGIKTIVDCNISLEKLPISTFDFAKIMCNIISNAVTALEGKQDGIIKVSLEGTENDILIVVENNGPPIPEEMLDHIFDIGITTKVDGQGEHGLGLAIVKEIVEKHNGRILAESDELSTEFVVTLPLK